MKTTLFDMKSMLVKFFFLEVFGILAFFSTVHGYVLFLLPVIRATFIGFCLKFKWLPSSIIRGTTEY